MKKTSFYIFIVSIFFFNIKANGQENLIEEFGIKDNISRVYISFQGFYYSYEKKLAKTISLYSDAGIGVSFGRMNSSDFNLAISPTLTTEGRWYFTYKRRYKNKKKILYNSAEFISLQAAYVFESINKQGTDNIPGGSFLVANVGLQRLWAKHINFELKMGYGIAYSNESNSLNNAPIINMKLGYVFTK